MSTITVVGGRHLVGNVVVGGSKNAALPILFSTLAMRGVSRIANVPDIGDVRVALDIMSQYGAHISRLGETLYVDTSALRYTEPDNSLLSKIRASTYLIGASLARFGKCRIGKSGGCNFSARPIDMHVAAAKALGASEKDGILTANALKGSEIVFRTPSVGATANALILAASSDGVTEIYNYAREPHVIALADFLRTAGADIELADEKITVVGASLSGGCATVIGDMIEAGSYLAAGLVSEGDVSVSGVDVGDMMSFLELLSDLGCDVLLSDGKISVRRARAPSSVQVIADPYPGFPTDLQPIAASLLARFDGGVIIDNVWQERFGYLDTLGSFGVLSEHCYGRAQIWRSHITQASVSAPDLRGGMACLLIALAARGESRISNAEIILRGYGELERKLSTLGARISII